MRVISTLNSFHGRTLFTVTAGGQAKYAQGFGPSPAGITHVPYNDVAALEAAFRDEGGDDICAVILEPMQGEGGHDAGHARVSAGGAAADARAQRAADPRRDPERHGPHGHAVLVHAEGHRPRHPHVGEGHRRRVPDRRDADDDRGRGRLRPGRARHHLRRQPARLRGCGRRVRCHQHDRGARRRQGPPCAVHGRPEGDQRAPASLPRPARRRRLARMRARRSVARARRPT